MSARLLSRYLCASWLSTCILLTHNLCVWVDQTFAGQDEWMEELLGDEYYVELFAEIAESEPITEAIDEVPLSIPSGDLLNLRVFHSRGNV